MEKFNLVKSTLARLFEEYRCMEITEEERGFQSHAIEDNTVGDVLDWEELSMYESSTTTVIQDKSELYLYLEEPRIKDSIKHYDVLAFWKSKGSKYRDLSRMARDVLAIPVSTVASESAFSAGGRVIDKYRSKLLPTNVEALICLRDWMFGVDFRAEPVDDASDLANALGNVLSLDVSGDTNITVEPTQRSSNASTAANV
ncbi:zinc finger BED domain-containing protein RICESLEEPER 2-like [Macadamia integrifolia]|uniref:zinc finger BED domain-containing protein RICESLEEPER 2-like n=1 Tax=Macadamia integrifolia TaxID=60698 RepID=UPI001C529009|nr:zinc finger BED domain-containing protein RICESLEEPER 2-like [Macadamia integrifolia]